MTLEPTAEHSVEIGELKSFSIYELSVKAANAIGRSSSVRIMQITGEVLGASLVRPALTRRP